MPSADDPLSRIFRALADPTRRAVLARLHEGPATVSELREPLDLSGPAVSQHLRVLEEAGLITRTVTAQWRTCRIRTEPLDEASAWIERHRADWQERFDVLDELVAEHRREGPRDDHDRTT